MGKRVVIYDINYAPEIAGVGRYTGGIGKYLALLGATCASSLPRPPPGWALQRGNAAERWTRETVVGAAVCRWPLYLNTNMKGVRRLLGPLSWAVSWVPIGLWQILSCRSDVVLVIEPTLFAATVGLLAAHVLGACTVLHVHNLEVEAAFAVGHLGKVRPIAVGGQAFDNVVSRAFDPVITISNKMAERIAAKCVLPDCIEMTRNWVDIEQIIPLDGPSSYRAELGMPGGQLVALYAGSLDAKQGIRVLVDGARVLKGRDDIVFVVAATGPMRPALAAAAAAAADLATCTCFSPRPG